MRHDRTFLFNTCPVCRKPEVRKALNQLSASGVPISGLPCFTSEEQFLFSAEKLICAFDSERRQWSPMGWLEQARIGCIERMLAGLDWVARRRGLLDRLPAHLATGIEGEDAACFYLRRKGYTVVARRWSTGELPGDVDLIAWDGPMLCFVEVKTRTARDATPAEVAVDDHKRRILRRLARQYVRQLPQTTAPPVRFDVISVYLVPGEKKQFAHFESSFGWSEQQERDSV